MDIRRIRSIIEQANRSIAESVDNTYKEVLTTKIHELERNIRLDHKVDDIAHLSPDFEVAKYLENMATKLDESI